MHLTNEKTSFDCTQIPESDFSIKEVKHDIYHHRKMFGREEEKEEINKSCGQNLLVFAAVRNGFTP
jgi:hypothetical protein